MTKKVKEVIKMLEDDGWVHVRTCGDHQTFKKQGVKRLITVPGKPNDELAIGTLRSILRTMEGN